jgi:hypothetical protein
MMVTVIVVVVTVVVVVVVAVTVTVTVTVVVAVTVTVTVVVAVTVRQRELRPACPPGPARPRPTAPDACRRRCVDHEPLAHVCPAPARLERHPQSRHTHRPDGVPDDPGRHPEVHEGRHRHVTGDPRRGLEVQMLSAQARHGPS